MIARQGVSRKRIAGGRGPRLATRYSTMRTTHLMSLLLALAITSTLAPSACAQISPEEHAQHHPGVAAAGPQGLAPAGPPQAGSPGGMEGMEKMMEGMGKAPPKELYPSLMSLPDLTPEQREQVRIQAQERMKSGVLLLSEGLNRLAPATENEDYAAMQEATAQVREAIARFESGLAARRALAEGKPPRQVALQWFKGEMNLQPPQGVEARGGLFGVTLFHLFTMVLLIAFALAMVIMYFFKMRRAAALFGRIETDSGRPPPGSAPPLATPPAADAKGA
jgi:glycine betaine catabolism B